MKDTKEMSDAKTANELAEKYAKSIGDGEESDAYEKRIAAWLAGHSAGLSEGVELAEKLTAIHDEMLDWLRGGSNCPHCALAMVKVGKAVEEFNANRGKGA